MPNETKGYALSFYSQERWNNWINKVKESRFKIEDENTSAVFVYMEDDVILACLKVLAKYDRGAFSKDEALNALSEIKNIVLARIEPIGGDADMMIESIQISLMGVFAACECYLKKAYSEKNIEKLVKDALAAEKSENIGAALGCIAEIGANILKGEELPDKILEEVPDSLVAEWLDGIDSIRAAMVGDQSYKSDEPDEGIE
jgi:hypothetical protein